jgi:hypothetical protein
MSTPIPRPTQRIPPEEQPCNDTIEEIRPRLLARIEWVAYYTFILDAPRDLATEPLSIDFLRCMVRWKMAAMVHEIKIVSTA